MDGAWPIQGAHHHPGPPPGRVTRTNSARAWPVSTSSKTVVEMTTSKSQPIIGDAPDKVRLR
jgi:hypothetical protein